MDVNYKDDAPPPKGSPAVMFSVADPDPEDPYVFGLLDPDPLVSGTDPDPSISQQK